MFLGFFLGKFFNFLCRLEKIDFECSKPEKDLSRVQVHLCVVMFFKYKTFVRDTNKIMNRTCFGMTGTAVEVMSDNCFVCSHALCICMLCFT